MLEDMERAIFILQPFHVHGISPGHINTTERYLWGGGGGGDGSFPY